MMSIDHSALKSCKNTVSCGLCFNNIVDTRGFVLMLTPKVCTQSIISVYKENAGRFAQWRSRDYVEKYCRDSLIVGFVRNPFDRLVSCWKDKCIDQHHRTWDAYGFKQNMTFEEFVNGVIEIPESGSDKHWRSQSHDLINAGQSLFDILCKFETISDDWDYARRQIADDAGAVMKPLPHVHATKHKHYSLYYTDELIEMVGDYYHHDLINFGYEFEKCH